MKKWFYIEYWNRYGTHILNQTLKAKSKEDAEQKFYNKHPYTLIRKISLID